MNTELSWERNLFSRTFTLYNDRKLCGYLKSDSLSQSALGETKGEVYSFKTSGVFKKSTIVYDMQTYKSLAVITYDEWRSRAILSVGNRVLYFKYDNLLQNKWQLSEASGVHIAYTGSSNKGYINATTDESILLLSGLLVADYYKKSQTHMFIYLMLLMIVMFIIVF